MSDNAPTFRLVFFYGLEPYPYVAKGSYVSLYDTPSLMYMAKNKERRNKGQKEKPTRAAEYTKGSRVRRKRK